MITNTNNNISNNTNINTTNKNTTNNNNITGNNINNAAEDAINGGTTMDVQEHHPNETNEPFILSVVTPIGQRTSDNIITWKLIACGMI